MGTFSDYFDRRTTESMGSHVPPGTTPYSLAKELGVTVTQVIQALKSIPTLKIKGKEILPTSKMTPELAQKVRAMLDQRRFKTQPGGPDGVSWMG